MSAGKIGPIEHTIQTTNTWLDELKKELGLADRHDAYRVLRAVLHALRDRLTVAETVDLGAQLPMLIRGLYYEGWTPNDKPLRERTREDFLEHVEAELRVNPEVYIEGAAWGVFKVLETRVSTGEIGDIKSILPAGIRSLWPGSEARSPG